MALPPLRAALPLVLPLLRPDLLLLNNSRAHLTPPPLTLLLPSRLLPCLSRAKDPVFSARWRLPLRKSSYLPFEIFPPNNRLMFLYSGVAVGSSIGHAIGGWFSGGSSAPAEQQAAPVAPSQAMDSGLYATNTSQSAWENPACATDAQNFRKCMDDNKGDLTICGWYLDQLKACQAAAKPY